MPRRKLANWGNYPYVEADVTETSSIADIKELIKRSDGLIARGNGRCYGDSSLGPNIFSSLRLNCLLSFDSENGTLECESGVLLSDILEIIVPKGFFLPVTPGTKFVSLGGAIAADVHGKNHHREGSFANHLISLDLLNQEGMMIRCSPSENSDVFWKTCGGMGLTGIIVSAKFRLKKIETSFITQVSKKNRDIDSTMRAFEGSGDATYSVAWIDCFGTKRGLGRSILQLGEHSSLDEIPLSLSSEPLRQPREKKLGVPMFMPAFALNSLSVRAFNTAYYHRQLRAETTNVIHFDPFFYPLDGILHWNRLFGKNGLVQYQFVMPLSKSYDGIVKVLETIRRSGQGSPLAVLKLFGKQHSRAVMSFPIEGYTLALDFKVCETVFRLLDELDEIVAENDGRVYLAKDARMSAEFFKRTYMQRVSSGYFRSAQSSRLQY